MTWASPWDSRACRVRVSSCRRNSRLGLTFSLTFHAKILTWSRSGFKSRLCVLQANGINLALDDGHVVLSFNNKIWKSNKQYHDDKWHYLTVAKSAGRYKRGFTCHKYYDHGQIFRIVSTTVTVAWWFFQDWVAYRWWRHGSGAEWQHFHTWFRRLVVPWKGEVQRLHVQPLHKTVRGHLAQ